MSSRIGVKGCVDRSVIGIFREEKCLQIVFEGRVDRSVIGIIREEKCLQTVFQGRVGRSVIGIIREEKCLQTVFEGRVDRSVIGIIREDKCPQIVFEGRDRPGSRVSDILGCRSCRGSRCEGRNLRKNRSHDSVDAADFLSGDRETGYYESEKCTRLMRPSLTAYGINVKACRSHVSLKAFMFKKHTFSSVPLP